MKYACILFIVMFACSWRTPVAAVDIVSSVHDSDEVPIELVAKCALGEIQCYQTAQIRITARLKSSITRSPDMPLSIPQLTSERLVCDCSFPNSTTWVRYDEWHIENLDEGTPQSDSQLFEHSVALQPLHTGKQTSIILVPKKIQRAGAHVTSLPFFAEAGKYRFRFRLFDAAGTKPISNASVIEVDVKQPTAPGAGWLVRRLSWDRALQGFLCFGDTELPRYSKGHETTTAAGFAPSVTESSYASYLYLALARNLVGVQAGRLQLSGDRESMIRGVFSKDIGDRAQAILDLDHHKYRTSKDLGNAISYVLLNPNDRKGGEAHIEAIVLANDEEQLSALKLLERCIQDQSFALRCEAMILKYKILCHRSDAAAKEVERQLGESYFDHMEWLSIKAKSLSEDEWLQYRTN